MHHFGKWAIIVGFLASVITIFVFITGVGSLRVFFSGSGQIEPSNQQFQSMPHKIKKDVPARPKDCRAKIVSSGGTRTVPRVSAFEGATGKRPIRSGTVVSVVGKSNSSAVAMWYLVRDSDGVELGWVSKKDIQFLSECDQ